MCPTHEQVTGPFLTQSLLNTLSTSTTGKVNKEIYEAESHISVQNLTYKNKALKKSYSPLIIIYYYTSYMVWNDWVKHKYL